MSSMNEATFSGTKLIHGPKCKFCQKHGHIWKNGMGFKEWHAKKGNDFIFMIYESLLVDCFKHMVDWHGCFYTQIVLCKYFIP